MDTQKTARLISRKNFLRLRFSSEENTAEDERNINIHDSYNTASADTSAMQLMDLPPEFDSFYAMQSKILGISDSNQNTQEVKQQMLKVLWESK